MVEAGELNRPLDSDPTSEKLLDFPIKSVGSNDFSEDAGGRKRAEKVLENPKKHGPGPVCQKETAEALSWSSS